MSDTPDDTPALSEARREAIRLLGGGDVPELLEDLARPLERGRHLAILAGEGSGKELLYGLAAALRCDPDSPELQALVLTPTRESALRAAAAAHTIGAIEGLACLAWPGVAAAAAEAETPFAHLLAGPPDALLSEVRAGRLGVGELRLLVIDGVGALEEMGGWSAVEALIDTLEPEAQRIACADRPHPRLDELLERRLPRASRWPPDLFPEPGAPADRPVGPETEGPPLLYASGVGEEARLSRLAEGLRQLAAAANEEQAFVHCGEESAAHRTAAFLAAAGFRIAVEADDPGVVVAWGDDQAPETGIGAKLGLPASLEELRRVLGPPARRLVVVEPRHLAQLELLVRRAGWRVQSAPSAVPPVVQDAVAAFRERVATGARQADAGLELLLLEPLLEELGSARVSAGLAALLREADGLRGPAPEGPAGAERMAEARRTQEGPREGLRSGREEVVRPAPRAPRRAARRERGVRPAWTRIWVSVGERDGAGPGDLVGAITGETDAVGGQIGKIEIRSSYSLIDLDSQIVDDVLTRLQGATIKGRDVHVKVARES